MAGDNNGQGTMRAARREAAPHKASFGLALGILALTSGLGPGCKPGGPPQIVDPGNQIAIVGETLTLNLFASDPDGDELTYSFRADGVENVNAYAMLGRAPDGHGVFTFQPVAGQEGEHIFDFIVSDGKFDTTLHLTIEVRGASGSESSPIFREPQAGVVLNLSTDADEDCASFDILVEDADSTMVELTQVPPSIPGAELDVDDNGLEGSWYWCPSREQREQFQYRLTLSADDHDNPATIKDVPIVLRRPTGEGCPGDAPTISHSPNDFETQLDLEITAEIEDDMGLKSPPVIFYAYEDPRGSSDLNWGSLSVAGMNLVSGDMRKGTWKGTIPNPTVEGGVGTQAEVFYVIEVVDDDDSEGECDHRTDSPSEGVHIVSVENTGEGAAGLCESCSFDVQCGSTGDLCIQLENGTVCGKACDGECPSGYQCSANPLTSVDGAASRQCVPEGGTCGGGNGTPEECDDDGAEPDDNPDDAREYSPITSNDSGTGTLCPLDDDWWYIELSAEAEVTVSLSGDSPPDMDLTFTNSGGQEIDGGYTVGSEETVELGCLDPGEYFAVASIYDYDNGVGGDYTLTFTIDPGACVTSSCEPEEFECDDGECIPGDWFCDGIDDCSDLSDEDC